MLARERREVGEAAGGGCGDLVGVFSGEVSVDVDGGLDGFVSEVALEGGEADAGLE